MANVEKPTNMKRLAQVRRGMAQAGRRIVRHGKHRYLTFSELARTDRDYVSWVLRSEALPTSLRDFARFVRSEFGGILMVGKHRMHYFTEILENDPAYCVWVAQLEAPTGSTLASDITWPTVRHKQIPIATSRGGRWM